MVDNATEQQLQQRFERLRADGQLCPCDCDNCPLRDAAAEIDAEGDNRNNPAPLTVPGVCEGGH